MTDKMLSEADLMAGRLRLNTLPLDSIDTELQALLKETVATALRAHEARKVLP